jgi:hypothetical protein
MLAAFPESSLTLRVLALVPVVWRLLIFKEFRENNAIVVTLYSPPNMGHSVTETGDVSDS